MLSLDSGHVACQLRNSLKRQIGLSCAALRVTRNFYTAGPSAYAVAQAAEYLDLFVDER
jgi:hypothetical protein